MQWCERTINGQQKYTFKARGNLQQTLSETLMYKYGIKESLVLLLILALSSGSRIGVLQNIKTQFLDQIIEIGFPKNENTFVYLVSKIC